ncbi:MAG: hypothetical protein VX000_05855, partial [Myxococcota bacterium]|nr:hypothetical protein [Myxococcota bacterium]
MSGQLEAAEALLATVQAGRSRLSAIAHRALPFSRALQLEVAYRVGNTAERTLLETPRSTRELPAAGHSSHLLEADTAREAPDRDPGDAAPVAASAPRRGVMDAEEITLDELIRGELPPTAARGPASDDDGTHTRGTVPTGPAKTRSRRTPPPVRPDRFRADATDATDAPLPSISLHPPTSTSERLEVIEHRPASPPPVAAPAAAIQILGVGKARMLTPTLALGSAEDELDGQHAGDGVSGSSGLTIGFIEPDEDADTDVP